MRAGVKLGVIRRLSLRPDRRAADIDSCRGQAEVTREEACSGESYGLRRTQVARIVIEGHQPGFRTVDRRRNRYIGYAARSRNQCARAIVRLRKIATRRNT